VTDEAMIALRNYDWLIRTPLGTACLDWETGTLVCGDGGFLIDALCELGFTPATDDPDARPIREVLPHSDGRHRPHVVAQMPFHDADGAAQLTQKRATNDDFRGPGADPVTRRDYCRYCLRPSGGLMFCQGCSEERARFLFAVRSVIIALWGHDGLTQFEAAQRARRLDAARRGPAGPGEAISMSTTHEADRERELAELEQLVREHGQQRPAPAPVAMCRPAYKDDRREAGTTK